MCESRSSAHGRWCAGGGYRSSGALSLSTFYFGTLTAYLPQRAVLHEANVALFFMSDALAIALSRAPSGALADRTDPRVLLYGGLALTAAGLLVLLPPATATTLVAAGTLCGLGAGIGVTAVLVMLQRLSSPLEAGSAFALFSVATAAGLDLRKHDLAGSSLAPWGSNPVWL